MTPDHLSAPLPCLVELSRQGTKTRAGPVDHPELRGEPHQVPGAAEPVVEFPVLGPVQGLVETAQLVQDIPAEDAEKHRISRARWSTSQMETTTAESQV